MPNYSQLMLYSRGVVGDYYDREGKRVRPFPTKEWLKKGVPSVEANDILRKYVGLLMEENGFIHNETRVWLMFPRLTQMEVGNKLVELGYCTEPKNGNSVKAIINLDRKKLTKYFPSDMLLKIVDYPDTDLQEYWRALDTAEKDIRPRDAWRNLKLTLPKCEDTGKRVTDERFMEFFQVIAPYTASQIEFIQSNIDREVLGYVQRIVAGENLTREDRERREMLLGLLDGRK